MVCGVVNPEITIDYLIGHRWESFFSVLASVYISTPWLAVPTSGFILTILWVASDGPLFETHCPSGITAVLLGCEESVNCSLRCRTRFLRYFGEVHGKKSHSRSAPATASILATMAEHHRLTVVRAKACRRLRGIWVPLRVPISHVFVERLFNQTSPQFK